MSNSSKTALAREVWVMMFDFLMRTAPHRAKSLGRRGLTPNDARALSTLDPAVGRTMRSLADEWECDASNATWIVDRLEGLGLATRRAVEGDRRAWHVVLTPQGLKTKTGLMSEYHTPPPELLGLTRDRLDVLHEALSELAKPSVAKPQRTRG